MLGICIEPFVPYGALLSVTWGALRGLGVPGVAQHGMVFAWLCLALIGSAWLCLALHGFAWLCLALLGSAWLCLALHGFAWLCLALLGSAWLCLALLGSAWLCLDLLGFAWLCLAFTTCNQQLVMHVGKVKNQFAPKNPTILIES